MKILFQVISYLALAGTILPSLVYFYGGMDLNSVIVAMNVSTILWFVFTPLWMDRDQS